MVFVVEERLERKFGVIETSMRVTVAVINTVRGVITGAQTLCGENESDT